MTLSANTTYRIFVEKLGATDPDAFIGNEGEVFFDPSIPTLKLSDGSTPGGIGIGIGTASVGTALTVSGDSGSETIDILSETLTIAGGTNLTSSAASDTVTVNLDSDILLDSVIATGIITAIGGFDGDLTGNVTGTASTATEFTVTANNSTNETVYPVFVDAATGSQGAETDAALSYNPSTNTLTAGTFNSTSDRKLKENVKVVKNASELINKLEGVNFTWIETGEKSVGVIAQQVESYIPELVSKNQEVKSVNYNGLVGILIEAFKEQQRQIEELKEVIQNL